MVDVEVLDSTTSVSAPATSGTENPSSDAETTRFEHMVEESKPPSDTDSDTEDPAAEDEEEPTDQDNTTSPSESPLVSTVRAYLEEEEFSYNTKNPDEDTVLFFTHLSGKNGTYKTIIDVKPTLKRVLVMVESPVKVVPDRRSIAAEYLMRVNYSLAVGAFEMDFRDGEVRNRTSIEMNDGVLTADMVRSLVMVPAATIDRFFNGLMQVVYGNRPPEEAYEECRDPGSANGGGGSGGSAVQLMQLLASLGGE